MTRHCHYRHSDLSDDLGRDRACAQMHPSRPACDGDIRSVVHQNARTRRVRTENQPNQAGQLPRVQVARADLNKIYIGPNGY